MAWQFPRFGQPVGHVEPRLPLPDTHGLSQSRAVAVGWDQRCTRLLLHDSSLDAHRQESRVLASCAVFRLILLDRTSTKFHSQASRLWLWATTRRSSRHSETLESRVLWIEGCASIGHHGHMTCCLNYSCLCSDLEPTHGPPPCAAGLDFSPYVQAAQTPRCRNTVHRSWWRSIQYSVVVLGAAQWGPRRDNPSRRRARRLGELAHRVPPRPHLPTTPLILDS